MQLQADCLYGVRTARCLENTNAGSSPLSSYPELVRALSVVKRACAQANAATGFLDPSLAQLIAGSCDEVIAGTCYEHFPVDMLHGGGYIGFNINVNEVLANLSNRRAGSALGIYDPVCPKKHVNLHQSTADVCATAARLAIIERWQPLFETLKDLERSFHSLAVRFADIETVARTCLMDAMPVNFGDHFSAYAAFVDRRKNVLVSAVDSLHCVNIGGTVIGSGSGAPEAYRECVIHFVSEGSGRSLSRRMNLYDAAQNIDDLADLSAQLRITADGLLKIASDIRLLGSGPSCGFGELILPAVQDGSSFFPGKVNPVVPETLMQVCMQVAGFDRAVQAALEHGELNLNVFEGVALKNILDAERLLQKAIALFIEKCTDGIEIDAQRCAQHVMALASNSGAVSAQKV